MTEDIRALTAQLAADPSSLVFLRLGEALRRRGQLEAALKVSVAGLTHYPHLPDAHDLYARILTDRFDYATAFDEWDITLRLAPDHLGAHKGIGFLYYRAGDLDSALHHLRIASTADPDDEGLREAVERVAEGGELWDTPLSPPVEPVTPVVPLAPAVVAAPHAPRAPRQSGRHGAGPFSGLEDAEGRLLLLDADGLRLGGELTNHAGVDVGDQVAAEVSSCGHEASRVTRLLELGTWQHLTIESPEMSLCLLNPTPDTSLIVAMQAAVPAGQLNYLAERAARAARSWLERVR